MTEPNDGVKARAIEAPGAGRPPSEHADEPRSGEMRAEADKLRDRLQTGKRDGMKALACIGLSIAALAYLAYRLPGYPAWTLLFLVPLGVFLFSNWGAWRSTTHRNRETRARIESLEKRIEELER